MNTREDRLSVSMQKIPPSGIRKFFEMLIGHDDVISLSVGEPDFPTPWAIREEAFYHLEKGHTSYTSNWGLIELREEIAKYMSRYGMTYNPQNEVLVTVGASEGVDAVLRAILNPGDEIIVVQPCYVNYTPLAELCQAKIVPLDSSVNGYYPTADQIKSLITPKTKAVMMCSPNNPTGTMIPRAELEKIAEVVKENQIWCISDEIYCELAYDGFEHVSIGSFPGMKDYTIILNGFSKSFAMTGWRIGYIAAPAEILAQIVKLHGYNTICAPIFSQYGAVEGLKNCFKDVEKMRVSYQQRRNYMYKAFTDMGLPVPEPTGAFYMFPDISSTGLSDEEFATQLFQKYNVAVVPGSVFGLGGQGHIRCCYATAIDKIKIAMERIAEFVKELKKE
ncbi:MAG: aminotransferase class I/II-fold pyridoxal phosphate-dependent enzyme [Treponema sp.]|uniref:pyridoxal phosphate-dependent aminotransferase n=1 Tax=Treponema sp. TaxID=166 RepID=UPI001DB80130|nr:aminotransferase class I/II-fold pyridoxal phosphate-dependent enzyme [Treponema sp.]MBS7311195.1 aminotransferase class I/II-fold pyridoxal phosphate-dependent enzyme [Treponema sp.]MDD5812325.1 aminotransferase class I/II-fold pyridoxal phosphate-dependent enzyme [Treponema sp.]MDY5885011.1 aminotransferase class I/II-fold pyridoxal phosphate-dependent enzyme [Treponema sp.]